MASSKFVISASPYECDTAGWDQQNIVTSVQPCEFKALQFLKVIS